MQEQELSSSQRSPGLPKMEDVHFGLKFQDSAAATAKWLAENPHTDQVDKVLKRLQTATDAEAFRKELFANKFAYGMGTGKDIVQTVKERLQTLTEDERSHRAVSADISFMQLQWLPSRRAERGALARSFPSAVQKRPGCRKIRSLPRLPFGAARQRKMASRYL